MTSPKEVCGFLDLSSSNYFFFKDWKRQFVYLRKGILGYHPLNTEFLHKFQREIKNRELRTIVRRLQSDPVTRKIGLDKHSYQIIHNLEDYEPSEPLDQKTADESGILVLSPYLRPPSDQFSYNCLPLFKDVECEEFSVSIRGYSRQSYLWRARSPDEAYHWVNSLMQTEYPGTIIASGTRPLCKPPELPKTQFSVLSDQLVRDANMEAIPRNRALRKLANVAETGDLLLIQTRTSPDKFNQIAVCVRLEGNSVSLLMLYEETPILCPLEDFLVVEEAKDISSIAFKEVFFKDMGMDNFEAFVDSLFDPAFDQKLTPGQLACLALHSLNVLVEDPDKPFRLVTPYHFSTDCSPEEQDRFLTCQPKAMLIDETHLYSAPEY